MRDEQKRPFGTIRQTIKFDVNTNQDVARKNVQYDGGFNLPPGKYNLKFVVRENQTGRMGSFETEVMVPDLKGAPVKVSSVVLSNQKQAAKARNNPLVRDGSEIVPNVTHVFSSGQHMYFYYAVYDPTKPAESTDKATVRVLSNVAFYKGSVKAYETPLVEADMVNIPERKAAAFELDVPLADLKPGFYTVQVNVVDDAAAKIRISSRRAAGEVSRELRQSVFASKVRLSDPLPPTAAVPLCKGDNNAIPPLQRGRAAKRQGVAQPDF